ncbi:hypothetical protein WEI85_31465 [Actinomycetes bacterium KLBMP 9797]
MIDPDRAVEALRDYLATAGITDWLVFVDDGGEELTVTVAIDYDPLLVEVICLSAAPYETRHCGRQPPPVAAAGQCTAEQVEH